MGLFYRDYVVSSFNRESHMINSFENRLPEMNWLVRIVQFESERSSNSPEQASSEWCPMELVRAGSDEGRNAVVSETVKMVSSS